MSIKSSAFEQLHPVNPIFPVRINYNTKSFSFPPHYHRALEVVYLVSGELSIEVNHTQYLLRSGDLLFIGSHHIHSYQLSPDLSESNYYMMIFDWQYLDELVKESDTYNYLSPVLLRTNHLTSSLTNNYAPRIREVFEELYTEFNSSAVGHQLLLISNLYKLLGLAARLLSGNPGNASDTKKLEKAHAMIHTINKLVYTQYRRDIPLIEGADLAGYSLYHFTRLFKEQTGFTFKEYLTNFRINMAKEALINDIAPVTEIAFNNGFNSIKTFNRNFKEITGLSPSDFRKSNK